MIEVEWERRLHQAGSDAGLASHAGGVVVHERNTRVVCLDPVDGAVRWDVPVGRWPRAIVVAGSRCLVLPQDTDRLVCLDFGTGEVVWQADLRPYTGHVVVDGDTVLVGGWRGYTPLRALDTATGRTLWETAHRVHTVRPVAVGAGFLVGEPGGTSVRVVDRREPREISAWPLPSPLVGDDDEPAFTAVGPDRLVVRCGDHAVVEVVPATATVREFAVAGTALSSSAPQHVGGLLWLRERGTGVTVADARDGRVRWRVDVGRFPVGRVVPVESGAGFVLADGGGTLTRLDPAGRVTGRAAISGRVRALRPLGRNRVLALTKGALLAAALTE
ncbi:MAG: PQQ-binding-like beta-propeller repeat protein [Saccharothrix sp.]|nr:PQQ-binding-like beta-propeller repeat protein [Saccharothrix sp.]